MAKLVLDNNEWAVKDSSFTNVATETINLTDGTWTLLDFDSTIKSLSFNNATAMHTIVLNARTASVDNRWHGGSICTMPRWYKDFKIDGVQITNQDLLSSVWRLESDLSDTSYQKSFVAGFCIDPTSTALDTVNGNGAIYTRSGGGAPAYGSWQYNGADAPASANNNYGLSSVMRGYAAIGGGSFLNVRTDTDPDSIQGGGTRNSNRNADGASANSNLRLIVAPGTRSNGDALPQDGTIIMNIRFSAFTIGNLT